MSVDACMHEDDGSMHVAWVALFSQTKGGRTGGAACMLGVEREREMSRGLVVVA